MSASRLVCALLLACSLPAEAIQVLTQHNDSARTGANLEETQLTTANVNAQTFGKIFARAVDDEIYTQPLYLPAVDIPGQGIHAVVYVATVNNSVYAFDADNPRWIDPLWKRNYNDPANGRVPVKATDVGQACGTYKDFSGNIGIVGTPVIDPATQTMYFVTRTRQKDVFVQNLHAIDVRSGAERPGSPREIKAQLDGKGESTDGQGHVVFNPRTQNQRMAIALSQGQILIGWASHCDTGPYHGWLMAYDAETLQQSAVFNVTPDGEEAGLWQAGEGPSIDAAGSIYVISGNGTFTAHQGGRDYGEAFLKLKIENGQFTVQDWFVPHNYQELNDADLDLGASGALLIPGTELVLGGGKGGILYLLDRQNMGHFQTENDNQIVQSFNASDKRHIHSSPAYWEGPAGKLVYMWAEHNKLKAFHFNGQRMDLPAKAESTMKAPDGMPGGFLSISADGSQAGTGILWASHPYFGDANQAVQPGILRAFDASDISRELWNSYQNVERDDYGNFAKFVSPTIAAGRVYQPSFSNQLTAFGLLPETTPVEPESEGALVDGRVYGFVSTYSQKCLDVPSSSKDDGAKVQQWDCNNTNAQKFKAMAQADGTYQLVNVNSLKCLDITDQNGTTGAALQQWTCHEGANQRFRVVRQGDWGLVLIPAHSQLCVDVEGPSKQDGAKVQQWDCHYRANQRWLPLID